MNSIVSRGLASILACLLLSGCASFKASDIPLLSTTGLDASDSVTPAAVPPVPTTPGEAKPIQEFDLAPAVLAGEQRFQAGDAIKVSVWGYPELDYTATVQPNGRITLPLVGEVAVDGLSVSELRKKISDLLLPYTKVADADLRPGDTLAMEAWQWPDLSKTVAIAPDGTVVLPLVGQVAAAGRPIEDIRKEVETKLQHYVRDVRVTILPTLMNRRVLYDYQVSVLAAHLEPRRAAVIGEVGVQGLIEIKGGLRLLQALAQAQVMEKTAELNSIIVIRNHESAVPQYRKIRLTDYLEGRAPDQNIYLQNDDIVIVPKTAIAKVDDFVELFFTRTAPAFSWWAAAWQASVASQTATTTRLINESLRRDLLNITPATP